MTAVRATHPSPAYLGRLVAYGAVGAVIALPLLVLLAAALVGLLGSFVLAGIPMLAGAVVLLRLLGRIERRLLGRMGLAEVTSPDLEVWLAGSLVRRLAAQIEPRTLAWFLLRAVTGSIAALVLIVGSFVLIQLLAAVAVDGWIQTGGWRSTSGLSAWWYVPLAAMAMLSALAATAATAWIQLQGAGLLGPSPAAAHFAARRAAEEQSRRTRLARELHDTLGHSLTLAVLQAATAERLLGSDPDAARAALGVTQEQGRCALRELDRTMALLEDRAVETPETATADSVAALVQTLRVAGLRVTLKADPVDDLDSPVSAAVYSIVRESGTNALRHAPEGDVTITIRRGNSTCEVVVTNTLTSNGTTSSLGRGSGRGLHGLRLLCEGLGGSLESGLDAQTWRVCALLPLAG